MSGCCLCNSARMETLIESSPQPLGNRFLRTPEAEEYRHSKHLSVCLQCGLVQMVDPVPAEEMMPVYDWITYNEPEPHLDRTAEILYSLEGIGPDSIVGGISFKDDSTLKRMDKLGVASTWRIDPERHLGVTRPGVGVETVQARLAQSGSGLGEFMQSADILVSRHILEHCHDLQGYIRALKTLIKPGGYLFLEAPCCDEQFEQMDYAPLWEEHLQYYTPTIFKMIFKAFGFDLIHYERVSYPMEDSLVGIGRMTEQEEPVFIDADALKCEVDRALNYGCGFEKRKRAWHEYLADFTTGKGKIAMFGAGHLGCTFVNLLDLSDYISFFVDDNQDKAGMYMPGSRLPIMPSSSLVSEDIKLALMCFNPVVEQKVIANNTAFTDKGGLFASIFPKSDIAMNPEKRK